MLTALNLFKPFVLTYRLLLMPVFLVLILGCSGGSSSSSPEESSENGTEDSRTLNVPADIAIRTESKQVTVTWPMEVDVTYDLFWSTNADLDPDNAATSDMAPNIDSPYVLDTLQNDQNYFFYLRASYDGESLNSDRLDTRVAAPGVDRGNTGGGGVSALVQSDDGRIFLGGSKQYTGHGYGRLQVVDDQFGFPRAHPLIDIRTTAVTADGEGGYFFATQSPTRIKRVDQNGKLDDSFEIAASSDVLVMLVHNETLYVGGEFSTIAGVSRDHLAALTLDGDVLGWSPNPNDYVNALLVHDDILYIGGEFSNAMILGEEERDYVAAFDLSDNRSLTDWAPSPNGRVEALAVMGEHIVLGGNFSQIDSEDQSRLAMIDLDGDVLDFQWELSGSVEALASYDDWLYVGGQFTQPHDYLFRVEADGTIDESWPEQRPQNRVYSLLASETGVYAGGSFTVGETEPHRNFVKYRTDGTLDTSIGRGVDQRVNDLALVGDKVVIVGESLIRIEEYRQGLSVMDLDGRWQDFPVALDGRVQFLNIHQGRLYVGGSFEQARGSNQSEMVARSGVAVFDLETAALEPFAPQVSHSSFRHEVNHILPMDGQYVIAGLFNSVNGIARQGLTLVDQQGANGDPIDGTDEADGRIYTLALTNDHLYLGGQFSGFGGEAAAIHIARVHRGGADKGEVDDSWLPDISETNFASVYGVVSDLNIQDDLVYMAGAFTEFNGDAERLHLAAINTSGTLSAWTAELSGPGTTRALNLEWLPDEEGFLVAGTFTTVDGTETGRLAIVKRDGGGLETASPLSLALKELQQSDESRYASWHPATGNICVGMMRHEDTVRLRVGVYCIDSAGNLLW
ncbi:MAG: hypothetical protein LAT62_09815 [Natronospirillum sp.]|uniref:hypothetical protein n=1 Tax=Natronospirillum sp. TaxID=2812955 RepID=UPI0025D49A9A|nr:hypothetical protein [Natronospirillum sp.]MCH8552221.1 hypothetical protein [Natronospirillum sp.]